MNRDCRKIAENLIAIVENIIPESQKKEIQDHLAACPRCNRLVKNFTRTWEELSVPEKRGPSEEFWPGLVAKIQAAEEPPLREKIIIGFKDSLRPVAVGLVLLFGILFGYQLGNMRQRETVPSEMLSVYAEQYVEEFLDFPEGSVGDFYTQYKIQNQQEVP